MAARPLFAASSSTPVREETPGAERWRRQKEEALAAIRDAEFDLHVGKLSESDYRELRARLEASAVEALRALGKRESDDHS